LLRASVTWRTVVSPKSRRSTAGASGFGDASATSFARVEGSLNAAIFAARLGSSETPYQVGIAR
jgi:hypothetical protein